MNVINGKRPRGPTENGSLSMTIVFAHALFPSALRAFTAPFTMTTPASQSLGRGYHPPAFQA